MKSGIYTITNKKNNKVYVGSTVDLNKRWSAHKSDLRCKRHSNSHLQGAWNKYGEDAFEFGILEYLNNSEELYLAEQFWMDIYLEEDKELYNFGFCVRHPQLGTHLSEETKRKISEAHKGMKHTDESRRKMSVSRKGTVFSDEHRYNLSRAGKGNVHNAKAYFEFINRITGEIILAGKNIKAMCQERGLDASCMSRVNNGKRKSHKNWVVHNMEE